jgi:hypothetical protein
VRITDQTVRDTVRAQREDTERRRRAANVRAMHHVARPKPEVQ